MTTTQPELFAYSQNIVIKNGSAIRFNGSDYSPKFDQQRLTKQILRVFDAMKDSQWRTLGELESITGDPQASLSAQCRNLRKERFGGHTINKRRRGDPGDGLWEYQLCVNINK